MRHNSRMMNSAGMTRLAMLEALADLVPTRTDRAVLFGIDGADGSGKTVLAGELAQLLRERRRTVHLVHIDDFHAPRSVRYRLGRESPEGFLLDSYDDDAVVRELLDPVADARPFRTAVWDLEADRPVDGERRIAAPGDVVLVEGIFLHRDLFAERWDASVFVDVPFAVTARRMAMRDGTDADPEHPAVRRYVEGQRLYFARFNPRSRATSVVDNTDLDAPVLLHERWP